MNKAYRQLYNIFIILMLIAIFTVPVVGQSGNDSVSAPPDYCNMSQGMGGKRHEGPRHQRAREMMLSLKIWKLTDDLQIDEQLAEKIYPRVRKLEELRYQQMKDIQFANQELRMALERGDQAETLRSLVEMAQKIRLQHATAEMKQLDEIFELLTVEQQAKFLLGEADFHQNLRRFLHDRRDDFKNGGNPEDPPR